MQSGVSSRPNRTHVFIIDGTLSRLQTGDETNAGLLYKLLTEQPAQTLQTVGYHPGVQASGLRKWIDVAAGIGINQSILQGYAALCSRFHQGDKIMLFGYSRGAYAVRSLAGFISRIGLIRKEEATERRIERAFRYYEATRLSPAAEAFCDAYCHSGIEIEVLGVWDTVKALGLPYPILNRLAPMATEFHDHSLTANTKHAYQALALDENRRSYTPLPWRIDRDYPGKVSQMWFSGAHPDIGGQVAERPVARTLSNIPLVWMLENAEECGLLLPKDWRHEFPQNPATSMLGAYHGHAKLFISRGPRQITESSGEAIHPSVYERMKQIRRYKPRARLNQKKIVLETAVPEHTPSVQEPQSQLARQRLETGATRSPAK